MRPAPLPEILVSISDYRIRRATSADADAIALTLTAAQAAAEPRSGTGAAGNVTRNVEPSPGMLSTSIVPPS